ncbi:transcriptional regulator, SarA/Rot family [Staphylococcus pettenkoferi]|uniref:MarR family transcriptional regulator n=1 Tax=Staphylococcus pettenkoferi TaxID=170573 RepID=A0A9Q4D3U4_9STAP|nr:MarR family transcriptional regulator [Staphylococcus pettenkoferi]MCY1569159.1 MarR family transcriptional regulator [Staphylococcus pettenkoferi]MCY1575193.1 MarR family transcriptional regulator [Staphylococcus pettenkoferi]MCY1593813.1 MarR family transcriptional regulator [Staphylococcus pettenkoferi]MCY1618709.1 MarR family transcriptional regulator [Staphylococcus pettenkoferi]
MIKTEEYTLDELIHITPTIKDFYRRVKKERQLTYEEISVLYYVAQSDENTIPVRHIAQRSFLKPYFLSKAVQKLKDKGYLDKKRSQIDQRQIYIEVTDEQRIMIQSLLTDLQYLID